MWDDPRAAWNALDPTSVKPVDIEDRTEFFTHWNGRALRLSAKGPHAACLQTVRNIQAQHRAQGWSDIGYNALCCPHARLIEGRGRDNAGAHCPDHNTTGIGTQFMLGKGETATAAMLERVRVFYDECCDAAGHELEQATHADHFPTECAGPQIAAWTHAGMPAPEEDEDMTPQQEATLNQAKTEAGYAHKQAKAANTTAASALSEANSAHIHAKAVRAGFEAFVAGFDDDVQENVRKAMADAVVQVTVVTPGDET